VPRGAVSERPILSLDVAPAVAGALGFRLPGAQGQPLRELAF
jgi:hypothetical protein